MRVFWILFGLLFFSGAPGLVFASSHQPAFPTDFTVAPQSACSVDLDWTQTDPGAFYFVYQRSRDNFSSWVEFRLPPSGNLAGTPPASTSDFSVTQNSLFQGTEYWYRVQACDPNKSVPCSSFTASPSRTTLLLPGAPEAISWQSVIASEAAGLQDIDLTWATTTQSFQYGGFSIFRSSDGGGSFSFLASVPYDRNFYRDLGLSPSNNYAYYIKQYNSALGCVVRPELSGPTTSPNNQAVFSPASATALVPRGPTSLDGSFTTPSINLTWTDNSTNENSFEVWKSTDSAFPAANRTILTAAANSTSYSDSSVSPNTTYYYKVRACTTGVTGCSIFSNVEAVSTGLASPTLGASVIYVSTSTAVGEVYLFWGGVGGAENYEIQRSTSSVFSQFSVRGTRTSSEDPNFYDQSIPIGEKYYYRVLATAAGQSASSNIVPANLKVLLPFRGAAFAGMAGAATGSIGWIKFSSEEEGGVSSNIKYNVYVDNEGVVSGLAWASPYYGWLSFNASDLTGCPALPCEARYATSTRQFSGWARFRTPKIRAGESSWDGWVKLRGSAQSVGIPAMNKVLVLLEKTPFAPFASFLNFASAQTGPPYGANLSLTGRLSGAAWGSDVVGWIGFGPTECTNCTVRTDAPNLPPEVTGVAIEVASDFCAAVPAYRVRWDYFDPEGAPQNQVEINFVKTVGGAVSTSTLITQIDQTYRLEDPLGFVSTGAYNSTHYLSTGTSYKTEVRVSDGLNWSDWVESANTTTTPTHYYPLVNFSWIPDPTATGTITAFTDTSVNRSQGAASITGRTWQFPNGTPNQSAEPNPRVVFNALPSNVNLTVEDSSGAVCLGERTVNPGAAGGPLKRRIFRER